jgi:hypothetical protein
MNTDIHEKETNSRKRDRLTWFEKAHPPPAIGFGIKPFL